MDEFEKSAESTGERSETDDKRDVIKRKLRQYYDGRIVRKDLTKQIRECANVPVYVLESAMDLGTVPADLVSAFSLIFYSSPEEAVFKALGVE